MENPPSGAPAPQVTEKHTPGPWKVEPGGFVGGPIGYGRICQFWNKFEEDFQNADANARLIAAAPELLEALKLILNESLPAGSDSGNTLVAKLAEQAIAKAEGRS